MIIRSRGGRLYHEANEAVMQQGPLSSRMIVNTVRQTQPLNYIVSIVYNDLMIIIMILFL